jgi:RecJ-like exonuclease
MSADWKTVRGEENSLAAPTAEGLAEPAEPGHTRSRQHDDACAQVRHDASIVMHLTGAGAAGGPAGQPGLLWASEYECAFCSGTGRLPNKTRCPVCRGRGKVRPSTPVVRCAFCHGRGQVPPRSMLTCCVCNGAGVVSVRAPIHVCPECKGRGRKGGQSLSCAACRGTGVVTEPDGQWADPRRVSTGDEPSTRTK